MNKTGQFGRTLPDESLSEVSESGEKKDPIVVGKNHNQRCFMSLKDSRPYKCNHFAHGDIGNIRRHFITAKQTHEARGPSSTTVTRQCANSLVNSNDDGNNDNNNGSQKRI